MDAKSVTRLVNRLYRVLPVDDTHLWDSLATAVLGRIEDMTPVEVVTCCHSFAKAGIATPELYRALTDRLTANHPSSTTWDITTWHPRQISLLLWCVCTSACTNWNLIKLLTDLIPTLHLSPTDVACTLSGLARANLVCESVTLAAIPIKKIFANHRPSVHTLCTALHSLARLASLDDRLLTDHRRGGDVFPASMSSWLTQDLIQFLVSEIIEHKSNLSFRALAMLTWSLGKLRVRVPEIAVIFANLDIPELLSQENRADLVTIISSIACADIRPEILAKARSLLDRIFDWPNEDHSTIIHLLWSIGMMEGDTSPLSDSEKRIFEKLVRSTTERTDASMLFHYTLVRGISTDFPFGETSWKLTNSQWTDGCSGTTGSVEAVVAGWLAQLPGTQSIKTGQELIEGVFCDILINDEIVVEVNGPSHYFFHMDSGEMSLDTKTVRRNELLTNKVNRVVNISYLDFDVIKDMDKESRANCLGEFIS